MAAFVSNKKVRKVQLLFFPMMLKLKKLLAALLHFKMIQ
jgi:hypothetical protein